jgi:hypothetical protein
VNLATLGDENVRQYGEPIGKILRKELRAQAR